MAKDEPGNDGPSLELPSLGFGRKRRKKPPEPEPELLPEAAPAAADTADTVVAPPTDDEPTETLAPPPAPPAPVPEPEPAPPLFADEVEAAPVPEPPTVAEALPVHALEAPEEPEKPGRKARRKDRPRRELPVIGGMPASVLTGVLVGILTVGLTWGSLHLCEVVQGTSSCGNPGFLLLAAIMVVSILLGALMLRAWGAPDPGSTSFLGVGLMAVLALAFLVDRLSSWTMIIVIPLIAALTFALSHWVTTALVEPADDSKTR